MCVGSMCECVEGGVCGMNMCGGWCVWHEYVWSVVSVNV